MEVRVLGYVKGGYVEEEVADRCTKDCVEDEGAVGSGCDLSIWLVRVVGW